MFLSIYHNQSGEEFLRRLAPRESLDLRQRVQQWAEREFDGMAQPSFSEPGKHIPNGCGDYQAEIRHKIPASRLVAIPQALTLRLVARHCLCDVMRADAERELLARGEV